MFFLYIVFGLTLVKKVSLSPPRAMLYLAPQYNLLINVGVGPPRRTMTKKRLHKKTHKVWQKSR